MMSNKEWVIVDKTKLTAIADTVRATTKSENLIEIDDLSGEVARAIQIGSGLNTYDATADASEIMQGETAYANGMKVTGTFTIDEELNNQDNLITQIATILRNKSANTGTDTSDATAIAAEIFEGKTAYIGSGKVTGTFTIENELSNQSDLIAQLQTMVDELPEADGTIIDDVSKDVIEGAITEIRDDRVEKIRNYAFFYCSNLTSVNFPACTSIETNAFRSCSNLTSISFSQLTTIGKYAFANCSKLTSVNLSRVTTIESGAFLSCYSLKSVNFPQANIIGIDAFNDCSVLTSVSFPQATRIESYAFYRCGDLRSINFPQVSTIGSVAFRSCSSLGAISFPKATVIRSGAFKDCFKLSSAVFEASSVCTLNYSNAFSSTPFAGYRSHFSGTPHIYVPESLITAYQNATNWTYFSSYFSSVESLPIEFTIDGAKYSAENGTTTWNTWVNSAQNIHQKFYIENNQLKCKICNKEIYYSEEFNGENIIYSVYGDSIIDKSKDYFTTCGADIITFTTSDNIGAYHAEKGMTWGEWVKSEYNTGGYYCNTYGYVQLNDQNFLCYAGVGGDDFEEQADNIIIDGGHYYLSFIG